MHEAVKILKTVNDLVDPVLVTAFRVRRRGGRSAISTLVFLHQAWKAESVAKIQPMALKSATQATLQNRLPTGSVGIQDPKRAP